MNGWRAAREAFIFLSIFTGCAIFSFLSAQNLTFMQLALAGGWFLFALSSFFYNTLLDRREIGHLVQRQEMLQKMHQVLEQVYGYREDMAKDVRVYSQLLERGVGVQFANSLATFAESVEPTDTVFLIRIDNRDRQWYFNMAGMPVYESTAKSLFDTLSVRCGEWASNSGMVVRDKKAVN